MKIIEFEGLDGSFKETNSKALVKYLRKLGYNTELLSFPNYNSEYSIFVRKYLEGDYTKLSRSSVADFYLLDFFGTFNDKKTISRIEDCDILVLDRYIGTTLMYQTAGFIGPTKKELCKKILNKALHGLSLPEADLIIYLDTTLEYSSSVIEKRAKKFGRGNKLDIYERDIELLREVHQSHQELKNIKMINDWKDVSVVNKDNILKSEEEIFSEIREIVNENILRK